MIKCRDCKYCQTYKESIGTCTLTRSVIDADKEHNCQCYNRDLSEYDICYNCYRKEGKFGTIETYCDINDHYIGYVEFFEYWCRHWAKEKEGE